MKRKLFLAGSVLTLAIGSALSIGLPTRVLAAPAPAAPASSPVLDPGGIDENALHTMLINFGYNVTVVDETNNAHGFKINETRDGGWSFPISLDISSDGQSIWLTLDLLPLPDPARTPAAPLEALLEQNWNIGPAYFTKSGDQLFLMMPFHNGAITPAKLKGAITTFGDHAQDTFQYWDTSKWPGMTPVQAPAPINNHTSVLHPSDVAPRSPVDHTSESTAVAKPGPSTQPQ